MAPIVVETKAGTNAINSHKYERYSVRACMTTGEMVSVVGEPASYIVSGMPRSGDAKC